MSDLTLGPTQGQTRIAKYSVLITHPRGLQCIKQAIGNYRLGIFRCGQIWLWYSPSRSNKDRQLKSAYNLLNIGPSRALHCETNL